MSSLFNISSIIYLYKIITCIWLKVSKIVIKSYIAVENLFFIFITKLFVLFQVSRALNSWFKENTILIKIYIVGRKYIF